MSSTEPAAILAQLRADILAAKRDLATAEHEAALAARRGQLDLARGQYEEAHYYTGRQSGLIRALRLLEGTADR